MGKIMRKNRLISLLFIDLFVISALLLLINTPILNIWLSWSNFNTGSKISIKKSPNLSWETAWVNNGTPVCTFNFDQSYPQICSDGTGGAIIAWEDMRSAITNDIYVQRINSNGDIQWTITGRVICAYTDIQEDIQICSDGAGGAIIVWEDRRGVNWDIYAQRVNSAGDTMWTINGRSICTASGIQQEPQICSDGAGGAIIVWEDWRGVQHDIYGQRINSVGNIIWTANGTPICTKAYNQDKPQICSDNAGGAIITWRDFRNGTNFDIYAQRISSTGIVQWTPNGTAICIASNNQEQAQICEDGSGGAIITWKDFRSGANFDIYTQRINSNGVMQWTVDGVSICTAIQDQENAQILSDGTGGAIITWEDDRGGSGIADIYAQKVNSVGDIQWAVDGIAICTASDGQYDPQICGDEGGGAIITWHDYRGVQHDIYGQRINSVGNIQWVANGSIICSANGSQENPQICSDGTGGAIITWWDFKSGVNTDIYAQRIKNILPTSTNPGDIITSKDGSEIINWTLSDDSAGGKYRVLANDTNGNYYTWKNWTSWANNTSLNVPINLTTSGFFEYTIEYSDDQNQFGTPDTVKVEITGLEISGYNILILLATAFTIIVIIKRKIKRNRIRL